MLFACLAKHDYSEINIMFTFEKEMKGIFFSSATGASGIVCKMILKKSHLRSLLQLLRILVCMADSLRGPFTKLEGILRTARILSLRL